MSGNNNGWANPAPAGLIAVGIATILFYALLSGKIDHSAAPYIGIWLLGGFLVQFPVALIELKEGSVTGGNVFLFFASFFMFVGGVCDILGYVNGCNGWVMDATANGWAWIILLVALVAWTPAYLHESPAVMGILVCLLDAMVFFVTFMKLGVMGGAGVTAGTADIMQALQEARKREDIKAVLLRIDSPGGSAVAAQEVGEEIDRVRAAGKPVVASMGDVAASGGYWIAASCDEIYANPATTTGSIGVITELLNVQGLFEKLGIRSEVIKSGPYKDMGSMNREITPEERQILEDLVGDVYQQFLEQVETGRKGKIKPEEVRALADGRVMTGKQAQKSGLVDTMGNYYDALDRARELAHIEGEPQVVELNSADPLTRLLSRFSASSLVNNNTRVPMAY